jgi:hypothetical protein
MTEIQYPARETFFSFATAFRLAEGHILPPIQWVPGSVYLVVNWCKYQFEHDTVLYEAQEKHHLVFCSYIKLAEY